MPFTGALRDEHDAVGATLGIEVGEALGAAVISKHATVYPGLLHAAAHADASHTVQVRLMFVAVLSRW
mgnify:FL=1